MAGHPPSGTVTFLITDLEGSTRMWEQFPDAMRAAMVRHDELLEKAIAAHRGYLFARMGDGMAAAFTTAGDAVSSAVAIRQALAEENWGTTPLKARIGLHTAEAVVDDNGYASLPINRCARLMAAAHGGQVIVSGTTEALVRYQLPDGLRLIDLGEHRLRDLGNPMHVFQITSQGGEEYFPPLRTVEALPANLPIQAASSTNRTSGRSSRRLLAVVGLVLLGVAGALGVWQLRGDSERGDGRPVSEAPVAGPVAVPSIAATVPADIRSTGRLVVGVNVPYPPAEFKDASGHIVGFDVDLMDAVARTLGLVPDYREAPFEAIIPSVRAKDVNVGMSSFTDTKDRQELVDFVTYFQAGTLWARKVGSSVDRDNACGLRIGVGYGSQQETEEIPATSRACVESGKSAIHVVSYARQEDCTNALMAGDIDAMSADSPVTGFAVKTSGGALESVGDVLEAAPYGWPVEKGSPLAEPLRQALEHLIQTGEYRTIATMWGVDMGMIDHPVINGATG
jgi:ABC-type amino acid transport substrate-binding protein/class 3 adenylate cyclase